MNCEKNLTSEQLQQQMQAIAAQIQVLAEMCRGNNLAVLALLRTLEQLHREIREDVFQASLPDNRQALYALLKDIEEEGGWPYIDRMKLRSLLLHMEDSSTPSDNL